MSQVAISGNASGTGTLTIAAPNTNSNFTLTLPQTTATLNVNGPAFSAYASTNQSITAATSTKITFDTERFDTASCYNNTGSTVGGIPAYSFLPNVAGYYQFNTNLYVSGTMSNSFIMFYKNNVLYSTPVYLATGYIMQSASDLIYLDGTTDYVSVYFHNGITATVGGGSGAGYAQFSAAMVRSA
jgi:hypothetical protein